MCAELLTELLYARYEVELTQIVGHLKVRDGHPPC